MLHACSLVQLSYYRKMFAPELNNDRKPPVQPLEELFARTNETPYLHDFDFAIMRNYLPMVNSVVASVSDRLPLDCDRQEVVSVGTLTLARAMMDFVDRGMDSFESYAENRIREALMHEFVMGTERRSERKVERPEPKNLDDVDLVGCKILVVEDSAMIRKKLRFLLEKAKYEVFEAKSGEEGIWLAQECMPDLILLDVVMDRMDGFETCERLKEIPGFNDIPIVFLTGKTETEFIARGFRCGASDYIGKPFNPSEALPRIRTHLKIRVLSAFRQKNIDELQKLNVAKDKLLRMASHDLRNPLSAIHGLADLMKGGVVGDLNGDQKEMITTIHSAAGSMMQMLTDLLDLSALESNTVKLDLAEGNPNELGSTLVNLFQVSGAKKDIKLVYEERKVVPPVMMDTHQIRRVVENFLSNAIKFSPLGTTIRLIVWDDGKKCYFDVEDEGPGIPLEEQELLFKEFSRTSIKPTGGEKSTGLGLSICRGIADAHEGAVSMCNLEPKGARFRLELPLVSPHAKEPDENIPFEDNEDRMRENSFR